MSAEEQREEATAEIAAAIQRVMPTFKTAEEDPKVEYGSALIKYALVVDWLTPEGERILSRMGGNLDGDSATGWDMAGLLHEALNGEWD